MYVFGITGEYEYQYQYTRYCRYYVSIHKCEVVETAKCLGIGEVVG